MMYSENLKIFKIKNKLGKATFPEFPVLSLINTSTVTELLFNQNKQIFTAV